MPQKKELTEKQKNFIEEYVRNGDAVEATRFASVSLSKVAKTDGYPLRRTLTVYDGLPFFCLV